MDHGEAIEARVPIRTTGEASLQIDLHEMAKEEGEEGKVLADQDPNRPVGHVAGLLAPGKSAS